MSTSPASDCLWDVLLMVHHRVCGHHSSLCHHPLGGFVAPIPRRLFSVIANCHNWKQCRSASLNPLTKSRNWQCHSAKSVTIMFGLQPLLVSIFSLKLETLQDTHTLAWEPSLLDGVDPPIRWMQAPLQVIAALRILQPSRLSDLSYEVGNSSPTYRKIQNQRPRTVSLQ